jgi:hypothetical protein
MVRVASVYFITFMVFVLLMRPVLLQCCYITQQLFMTHFFDAMDIWQYADMAMSVYYLCGLEEGTLC